MIIQIFKKILSRIIGSARAKQLRNFKILARDYGQYSSIKNWDCKDCEDQPIPWYTYPAVEYLKTFNLTGVKVLEYGSGNSSLFYLNEGASVTSIEDDKKWFEKISLMADHFKNFGYIHEKESNSYVMREEADFAEIVVIDGSFRPECANHIVEKIQSSSSNPAMIIFDNSDWYPKTIGFMDGALGWHRSDFFGFGPINPYTWVTSIYLNPAKKIVRKAIPISSVNGVVNVRD
jgi:hypothetical protein